MAVACSVFLSSGVSSLKSELSIAKKMNRPLCRLGGMYAPLVVSICLRTEMAICIHTEYSLIFHTIAETMEKVDFRFPSCGIMNGQSESKNLRIFMFLSKVSITFWLVCYLPVRFDCIHQILSQRNYGSVHCFSDGAWPLVAASYSIASKITLRV